MGLSGLSALSGLAALVGPGGVAPSPFTILTITDDGSGTISPNDVVSIESADGQAVLTTAAPHGLDGSETLWLVGAGAYDGLWGSEPGAKGAWNLQAANQLLLGADFGNSTGGTWALATQHQQTYTTNTTILLADRADWVGPVHIATMGMAADGTNTDGGGGGGFAAADVQSSAVTGDVVIAFFANYLYAGLYTDTSSSYVMSFNGNGNTGGGGEVTDDAAILTNIVTHQGGDGGRNVGGGGGNATADGDGQPGQDGIEDLFTGTTPGVGGPDGSGNSGGGDGSVADAGGTGINGGGGAGGGGGGSGTPGSVVVTWHTAGAATPSAPGKALLTLAAVPGSPPADNSYITVVDDSVSGYNTTHQVQSTSGATITLTTSYTADGTDGTWALTIPAAPTDFAVNAGGDPNSVNIGWTDPSRVDHVEVLHSLTTGGPYTRVALIAAGVGGTSDAGLAFSTEYFYVARGVNGTALGPYTAELSITTEADPTPPTNRGLLALGGPAFKFSVA